MENANKAQDMPHRHPNTTHDQIIDRYQADDNYEPIADMFATQQQYWYASKAYYQAAIINKTNNLHDKLDLLQKALGHSYTYIHTLLSKGKFHELPTQWENHLANIHQQIIQTHDAIDPTAQAARQAKIESHERLANFFAKQNVHDQAQSHRLHAIAERNALIRQKSTTTKASWSQAMRRRLPW